VEENLVEAEAGFRELGYPYWTARAQLERAEWLVERDRFSDARDLAAEAATAFEAVGVPPMLARARALADDVVRFPQVVSRVGATGSV
jgi:hypothetical protein